MPVAVFQDVFFDVYPNTSGGQVQAQAKANQLKQHGYQVNFSVSQRVLWQNHVAGDVVDEASFGSGVVVLTSVKS
jgi:hypothetical protein